MSLTKFGEQLELRSEVEIEREPVSVWNALVELPRHEKWNPFWGNIRGRIQLGARVTFELTPPGGSPLVVRRRVDALQAEQELRWSGGYGWGWLLRSVQYFRLTCVGEGRTRLTVGENLRGPGVTGNNPTSMNIARGQALMNQALKRYLESLQR